jgi:hypothetical protein
MEADLVDETVAGAVQIYEKLKQLAERRRNGIWIHVIEQSFAPRHYNR